MRNRSIIVRFALCGSLLFGCGIIILNFISHTQQLNDDFLIKKETKSIESIPNANTFIKHKNNPKSIITNTDYDYKSLSQPEKLNMNLSETDIPNVQIKVYNISITNNKNKNILVREAGQSNYHILLLHGEAFTSKIWWEIGALQFLSTWGYRAVTIDIPKKGNHSLPVTNDKQAVQWLKKLIQALELSNLVIVSASASGDLTLPYIFQLEKEQQLVRGFVPIAPISTERRALDYFRQINIPTLVVHAEDDSPFQPAYEILIEIPNSEVLFMIDAGHDSYVDQPLFFLNGLRQFLYKVYRPIYKNSKWF
ncbi:unnamed protein product [Adineta steineri]|uniref:Alpha/beta hydrolase n=1 Tax=Adineta steineri TaxID=433720 RepID=A0A815FJ56_9BILA|nr:unnamed protein product [Adineta steineri]CAF3689766.1 unnamed protein product [Adineta steineri]